jgi:hypothetical protein
MVHFRLLQLNFHAPAPITSTPTTAFMQFIEAIGSVTSDLALHHSARRRVPYHWGRYRGTSDMLKAAARGARDEQRLL